MATISYPDLQLGRPRKVSSWTLTEWRRARETALRSLHGVGDRLQLHVDESSYIVAWRRPAARDEILALPDIGIAGEYKRKLLEG